MKTKKQTSQSTRNKQPFRRMMSVFVFSATITSALASFISLELAGFTLGLFGCAGLFLMEARRRNFWELSASHKFRQIEEAQKQQHKDILYHEKELRHLKAAQDTHVSATSAYAPYETDVASVPFLQPQTFTPAPAASAPLASLPAREKATTIRAHRPGKEKTQEKAPEDDLSKALIQELLRHALKNERVDVFVQPIVRLPQRQARFFEIYARIRARPGQYLPAGRYRAVAEQDNLMPQIDHLLLIHCLKTIEQSAHMEKAAPFFINVSADTLSNKAFMNRLLGFLSKNRGLAKRLIFEMSHDEFKNAPGGVLDIIGGLGKLGCAFSLDQVNALDLELSLLKSLKIRTLKIDQKHFAQAAKNTAKFRGLIKAKQILESNGVGIIIDKIETEEQMRTLLDYDIHYGQGYLFGKPELQGAYASRTRAKKQVA